MLRMRVSANGHRLLAGRFQKNLSERPFLASWIFVAGATFSFASPGTTWAMAVPSAATLEMQGPSVELADLDQTDAKVRAMPPARAVDTVAAESGEKNGVWSVARLISEIISANPRVSAQTAALRSARYDVSAARWQYVAAPSLQAETAGADRQLVASVTQPIFTFGRLGADLEAAKSRAHYAETRVSETSYQLAFRVLDLYTQFLSAKRAADVMQADVNRLTELGEVISRRVTSGASAPVDLNLVLTRIRQSENALISLQTRQINVLDALTELLGRPVTADMLDVPRVDDHAPIFSDVDTQNILEKTIAYNPLLKRAGQEVELAKIDQRRALNSAKPTIFGRFEQRLDHGRYSFTSFPSTRALVGVQPWL